MPSWLIGSVIVTAIFFLVWGGAYVLTNSRSDTLPARLSAVARVLIEYPAGTFNKMFGGRLYKESFIFGEPTPQGFVFLSVFYLISCTIVGAVIGLIFKK